MFGLFKKSATYTLDQLAGVAGWIGWGTHSGTVVNAQTAHDVTAVMCAARVIAEGCAQMPVRVLEVSDAGTGASSRVAHEHWAHQLLAVRPNSWQTSYEFREGMFLQAALYKGAIAIKNIVGGEVRELLPVPSTSWTVEQNSDYSLRIRIDYADKTHGYFDQSQVFYMRGPSLDGFQAVEAIRSAREAIGLSRALEKQQAKLAGNGGKPSGVLSFDQPLSPETTVKLQETWAEKFGPNGDGGIAVLDGGAKFSSLTMTGVDGQFMESRRLQIEEIARAFRVLPIMLMQADKAMTYASSEQMFRMHVIHTLGPWMQRFEQRSTRDILNDDARYRVDLDERSLLRGDFKDQSDYYTKALGAGGQPGWMSVNEIRAERDMNPVPEAWANEVPRGAMHQSEVSTDET